MSIHEWERDDDKMNSLEKEHLPLTEKPNEVMSTGWKMDGDIQKVELEGEKWSEKIQFTGKLMDIEQ